MSTVGAHNVLVDLEERDDDELATLHDCYANLARRARSDLRIGLQATEVEMKEKKARVEDAMHATQAAVEEGIVPGGGVALIRCAPALDALAFDDDRRYGVNISASSKRSSRASASRVDRVGIELPAMRIAALDLIDATERPVIPYDEPGCMADRVDLARADRCILRGSARSLRRLVERHVAIGLVDRKLVDL